MSKHYSKEFSLTGGELTGVDNPSSSGGEKQEQPSYTHSSTVDGKEELHAGDLAAIRRAYGKKGSFVTDLKSKKIRFRGPFNESETRKVVNAMDEAGLFKNIMSKIRNSDVDEGIFGDAFAAIFKKKPDMPKKQATGLATVHHNRVQQALQNTGFTSDRSLTHPYKMPGKAGASVGNFDIHPKYGEITKKVFPNPKENKANMASISGDKPMKKGEVAGVRPVADPDKEAKRAQNKYTANVSYKSLSQDQRKRYDVGEAMKDAEGIIESFLGETRVGHPVWSKGMRDDLAGSLRAVRGHLRTDPNYSGSERAAYAASAFKSSVLPKGNQGANSVYKTAGEREAKLAKKLQNREVDSVDEAKTEMMEPHLGHTKIVLQQAGEILKDPLATHAARLSAHHAVTQFKNKPKLDGSLDTAKPKSKTKTTTTKAKPTAKKKIKEAILNPSVPASLQAGEHGYQMAKNPRKAKAIFGSNAFNKRQDDLNVPTVHRRKEREIARRTFDATKAESVVNGFLEDTMTGDIATLPLPMGRGKGMMRPDEELEKKKKKYNKLGQITAAMGGAVGSY